MKHTTQPTYHQRHCCFKLITCFKMHICTCGIYKTCTTKINILTYGNGKSICWITAIASFTAQTTDYTPWETFIKRQRNAVWLVSFSSVTVQIIWRIFFWAHWRIFITPKTSMRCTVLNILNRNLNTYVCKLHFKKNIVIILWGTK